MNKRGKMTRNELDIIKRYLLQKNMISQHKLESLITDGTITKKNINKVFRYISLLEDLLDTTDAQDFFGTEGWRHHLGLEED